MNIIESEEIKDDTNIKAIEQLLKNTRKNAANGLLEELAKENGTTIEEQAQYSAALIVRFIAQRLRIEELAKVLLEKKKALFIREISGDQLSDYEKMLLNLDLVDLSFSIISDLEADEILSIIKRPAQYIEL